MTTLYYVHRVYFYEVILSNCCIWTNGRFNSNKSEQSLAVGFHPPLINHYLANQILCLQIKSKPMWAMIWYLHEQAITLSGEVVLCRKGSSSLSYISYGFLTQQRRMEFFKTSPLFPPWIVSLLSSAIANYREVFQCSHLSLWIDCFILSVFGYTSLQIIIIASLYALSVLTSTVRYHSLFFRTTGIIIYFKLQSWVEIPMVFLTITLLTYPCSLGSGSDWLRVQVGSYITNLHTWW